ncbi:MAG TPA: FliM/FliN family flagellar motor switch protein [Terriglobales bacterium]
MSDSPQAAQTFFSLFATATKEVISQITASDADVELVPASGLVEELIVPFHVEGTVQGTFLLRFATEDIALAAAVLMGETPENIAAPGEEQREAATELSRQICGNLATAIRERFGSLEIHDDPSHISGDARESFRMQLQARVAERTLTFEIAITDALLRSLQENQELLHQKEVEVQRSPEDDSPHPCDSTKDQTTAEKEPNTSQTGNLEMLLNLELPVTLRFGCREMLLKEVMELTSGSVIELDRRVREPVDLLIDNNLIARGEVVLVDGNYGVRILEIANVRDRIACLP